MMKEYENLNSLNSIQSDFPDLYDWVKSITRYGAFDKFVTAKRDIPQENPPGKIYVKINFWTERNAYAISARLPKDGDDGYLGCTTSNRKPRTGEDWLRGSDLPDGPYNQETWREIVNVILAYELSKLDISNPQLAIQEVENQPLVEEGILSQQTDDVAVEISTNG